MLAVEVPIQGLNLGEAGRVISAPNEETDTVGTVPLVTMWDERDGVPTTNGDTSSSSSSNKGGISARLEWREADRSISEDCDRKG